MKSIIYAGVGLFTIASVYGLADYYTSKKDGSLDKLYVEETIIPEKKETGTVLPEISASEVRMEAEKATTVNKAKQFKAKITKRRIKIEDYSRGKIEEVPPMIVEEPVKAVEAPVQEALPVKYVEPVAEKETTATSVVEKTERKLSMEMFSRKMPSRPMKKKAQKN